MNYKKSKNLLTTDNSKTIKGEKLGFTTYILYLAPHTQNSKGINLCSHASEGCAKACLFNSGAARFDKVQTGKRNKTEWYLDDRNGFMSQLDLEMSKIVNKKKHATSENTPVIRLNGTSDIPWEKYKIRDDKNIFELYPNVQFYDYTKNHVRFTKVLPSNYHLTFSMSETNKPKCFELLSKGANVAIVFGINKGEDLPLTYKGYEVVNGDETDLRFLDKKNVIVGLRYKKLTGKGVRNDEITKDNDFIIQLDDIAIGDATFNTKVA